MKQIVNIAIFQPFVISIALGALLGLERAFAFKSISRDEDDDMIAGVRTFSLISLLGCLSAFLESHFSAHIIIIAFGGILILSAISYYISYSNDRHERGITTEVSLLISFTIGLIVQKEFFVLATFITILTVMILHFREYLDRITSKVSSTDVSAIVKFGIITFVILPLFDPDRAVYIKDLGIQWFSQYPGVNELKLIAPYTVWLMVVLISGISFTGYIAIKIMEPRKGIGLTGFLGGLVSSTATTLTFSKRSKDEAALSIPFALAIMLACSTMFPRILVEVLIINYSLLSYLAITMGIMALAGFAFSFFIWKRSGSQKTEEVPLQNPFNIMPAVKFGLLYALIVFLARLMSELAGDSGLYILSLLSGLTDVDAITLTMSQVALNDPTKQQQAAIAIALAAFSNTIMKGVMAAAMGSQRLRKYVIIGFSIIVASGVLGLLIFLVL